MESLQKTKSRIKAVKNIGQITKAMEVVAATKMRKSQQVALNSRPYAFKALQLLSVLGQHSPIKTELMRTRPNTKRAFGTKSHDFTYARSGVGENTLLVIVTSDRGLAGSFNSQVLRMADSFLKSYDVTSYRLQVIPVGKKAISYASKKKLDLAGEFSGFGDFINPAETNPVAEVIINGFLNKEWDRVITISTHFRSTLKQEVLMRHILPVNLEKIQQTINEIIPEHGRFANLRVESGMWNVESQNNNSELHPTLYTPRSTLDYIFEPSPKELIEGLVDHLVRMQVYHLVLEANASEHSARMVAMKTASDNAKDLSEKLNLEYNKARQAGITKELIEITSAVSTLS